jgi:hypothetical protein
MEVMKDPNMKIIEYFLTIADTFHDFGKQLKNFPEIWSNNKNFNNSKIKSENGISVSNKPNTSKQLKFIVKLLGADIYRAVDRYNDKCYEHTFNNKQENRKSFW